MAKPTLRQPHKSAGPTPTESIWETSMPKSQPVTEQQERHQKMMAKLQGIREAVMLGDEYAQQRDYRRRVREGHQAMGELAGFDMPDYDDDDDNFVVATEGSTVNIGTDQSNPQVAEPKPQPPAPAPIPVQRNGNGTAKLAIGALLATGLLGAGGLGAYLISELTKDPPPQPPPVVQPEPQPETGFRIR